MKHIMKNAYHISCTDASPPLVFVVREVVSYQQVVFSESPFLRAQSPTTRCWNEKL